MSLCKFCWCTWYPKFKVPLIPKYFFPKMNPCICLKRFAAIFSSSDKSCHFTGFKTFVHYQVRGGVGLFLIWCPNPRCMHVFKELMRCKSVCDVKSGIGPLPFWLSCEQKMVVFLQVLKPINWQDLLEEGKNGHIVFPAGAKIHLSEKNVLGLGALKSKKQTQDTKGCQNHICYR